MKRKILFYLVFMMICILNGNLFAQDIIIKKNGEKIKALVKEVTDTKIKYVNFNDPNEILFTIDRALIKEVKFSYGQKLKEEAPNVDESYYVDDKRYNLKLNFTAIAVGYGIFTYESSIDPASSFEVSLKIPGLGITRDDEKLSGLGVNVGYKLKFRSLFSKKDEYRPDHLLSGWYFRPNAGYTFSKTENEEEILGSDKSTVSRSLLNFGLDFGRQYILNNRLSIDLYAGLHYYAGGINKIVRNGSNIPVDAVSNDYIDARGGDMVGGGNVAFSIGVRVGVLFDKKKDKKKRR